MTATKAEPLLYLKWTAAGRIPSYQGGQPIPRRRWTAATRPVICKSGWHACRWEDARHHIAAELWVCKLRGRIVAGRDKVAAEQLLIVRRVDGIDASSLRLFAADCAERALPLFESLHPSDERPRAAIEAARRFAMGEATASEAAPAAYAAACAYASTSAATCAAASASAAAYDAADASAYAAADASAAAYAYAAVDRTSAVAVERTWQTERLLGHYAGLDPNHFAHTKP